jgi:alkyl hydroperoxide reductase subunit AhpC
MMKRTSLLLVIGLMAFSARADSLKIGDKAPLAATKMKSVDGREISIAEVAGSKGTLVMFICNHCPFVKAWETRIADIGNTAAKQGIGVIAINSNDPSEYAEDNFAEMQKRAKLRNYSFPYVVDATSDVARAFGASRTPEVFLFDKDGKLAYHGAIDDNHRDASDVKDHYLRDALAALAAGKDVAVKESRAVGCSIKFRPKP